MKVEALTARTFTACAQQKAILILKHSLPDLHSHHCRIQRLLQEGGGDEEKGRAVRPADELSGGP